MAQQTFRSALNGFNREDVVRYIEYLNSVHTAEINQLNSELEYLRNQEPAAPAPVEVPVVDTSANDALIEQQASRIRELFDRCRALESQLAEAQQAKAQAEENVQAVMAQLTEAQNANQAATAQLAEAQEAKAHAEEKLQAVVTQQNNVQARANEELEAYRRAERIERLAKERAERLYHQTNGALADASIKVDEAAGQIGELTDLVMAQLTQLQEAVASSKQALKDAADTMYTIRPGEEN